jgi:hypothetical protein
MLFGVVIGRQILIQSIRDEDDMTPEPSPAKPAAASAQAAPAGPPMPTAIPATNRGHVLSRPPPAPIDTALPQEKADAAADEEEGGEDDEDNDSDLGEIQDVDSDDDVDKKSEASTLIPSVKSNVSQPGDDVANALTAMDDEDATSQPAVTAREAATDSQPLTEANLQTHAHLQAAQSPKETPAAAPAVADPPKAEAPEISSVTVEAPSVQAEPTSSKAAESTDGEAAAQPLTEAALAAHTAQTQKEEQPKTEETAPPTAAPAAPSASSAVKTPNKEPLYSTASLRPVSINTGSTSTPATKEQSPRGAGAAATVFGLDENANKAARYAATMARKAQQQSEENEEEGWGSFASPTPSSSSSNFSPRGADPTAKSSYVNGEIDPVVVTPTSGAARRASHSYVPTTKCEYHFAVPYRCLRV